MKLPIAVGQLRKLHADIRTNLHLQPFVGEIRSRLFDQIVVLAVDTKNGAWQPPWRNPGSSECCLYEVADMFSRLVYIMKPDDGQLLPTRLFELDPTEY